MAGCAPGVCVYGGVFQLYIPKEKWTCVSEDRIWLTELPQAYVSLLFPKKTVSLAEILQRFMHMLNSVLQE